MAEPTIPDDQTVDAILRDLEGLVMKPTEVARQARRLRAHIATIRDQRDELLYLAENGSWSTGRAPEWFGV